MRLMMTYKGKVWVWDGYGMCWECMEADDYIGFFKSKRDAIAWAKKEGATLTPGS